MPQNIQELIAFLKTNGCRAECPQCSGKMDLSQKLLFDAARFTPEAKELLKERKNYSKERKLGFKDRAQKKPEKIETTTQIVNIGFILERLAPSLQGFRFDKIDCRSLFEPIVYVIFEGLNKTGSVKQIIFTDIKTGDAGLNKRRYTNQHSCSTFDFIQMHPKSAHQTLS
jgi:predicted Holliday junction resolvase-like endonuclease